MGTALGRLDPMACRGRDHDEVNLGAPPPLPPPLSLRHPLIQPLSLFGPFYGARACAYRVPAASLLLAGVSASLGVVQPASRSRSP